MHNICTKLIIKASDFASYYACRVLTTLQTLCFYNLHLHDINKLLNQERKGIDKVIKCNNVIITNSGELTNFRVICKNTSVFMSKLRSLLTKLSFPQNCIVLAKRQRLQDFETKMKPVGLFKIVLLMLKRCC